MTKEVKMTKEQAIKIISDATSTYKGTRQDHILIEKAIVLLNELTESEVPEIPEMN